MKNDPLIELVKQDFARRRLRNRAYSLRSYARDLAVDASNLSKLLKYKTTPGLSLRKKLGKKIGLTEVDLQTFCGQAKNAKTIDEHYERHSLQLFRVISEWQHYAILECFKLTDSSSDPSSIAVNLGLPIAVVQASIKRLADCGLVKRNLDGWAPVDDSSSSILDISTSKAHRDQQQQILDGAISALLTKPIELRSQSSMTMAARFHRSAPGDFVGVHHRSVSDVLTN